MDEIRLLAIGSLERALEKALEIEKDLKEPFPHIASREIENDLRILLNEARSSSTSIEGYIPSAQALVEK